MRFIAHTVRRRLAAACTVLAATLSVACTAVPPRTGQSLAAMVAQVTPGVVSVFTVAGVEGDDPLLQDPTFRRLYPESPKFRDDAAQPDTNGSGVIIDSKEGYVVTNDHVVGSSGHIVVVLEDRREFVAKLIGRDPGTDLALLKIEPDQLAQVAMGDSDGVQVGDSVVAIGNPFGLGKTVTSGIISAKGRTLGIEGYEDYLQTDASINIGNSGGALVNVAGELIGINAAIFTPHKGNIGIAFAIPTSMVRDIVAQLKATGEVRRGQIGLNAEDVTPRLASQTGLPVTEGALVRRIGRASPAAEAGVQLGDVVQAVNGRPVRSASDLRNRVALVPVGSPVHLKLLRSGQPVDTTLTVAAVSANDASSAAGGASAEAPDALAGMRLRSHEEGLLVESVDSGSRAYELGFRAGDVLLGVNREPITDIEDLTEALTPSERHVISVLRGESKIRLVVRPTAAT